LGACASVVGQRLGIPDTQMAVCGMALGYPDPNEKVNTFSPERIPLSDFVTWVEALKE
jgi:hypothetical protein